MDLEDILKVCKLKYKQSYIDNGDIILERLYNQELVDGTPISQEKNKYSIIKITEDEKGFYIEHSFMGYTSEIKCRFSNLYELKKILGIDSPMDWIDFVKETTERRSFLNGGFFGSGEEGLSFPIDPESYDDTKDFHRINEVQKEVWFFPNGTIQVAPFITCSRFVPPVTLCVNKTVDFMYKLSQELNYGD